MPIILKLNNVEAGQWESVESKPEDILEDTVCNHCEMIFLVICHEKEALGGDLVGERLEIFIFLHYCSPKLSAWPWVAQC